MVNRIWYWLLGRGIVHEPDDLRPDNPPVNPELLALLEQELTERIRRQGIVVWLDRDKSFTTFVDRLAERHAAVFRTDQDGLVTIRTDGRRLYVETGRDLAMRNRLSPVGFQMAASGY